MGFGRDILYATGALIGAPFWIPLALAKGVHRTAWKNRFGHTSVPDPVRGPRILVHAVSVGEVASVAGLVPAMTEAGFEVVVSSTTETGTARAKKLFEPETSVVPFPLDWSRAVGRFLDNVRPDLVALVELEIWPNFVEACVERGIPVVVVGGRISDRSAPRYQRLGVLLRRAFSALHAVGAQTQTYADRFIRLGTPADRVTVTDSLKWDAVRVDDPPSGREALARTLGVDLDRPLVVAGSTGPGEEAMLARDWPPDVQLLVAPRKPERFAEVAAALPTAVRHSRRRSDRMASTEAANLFLLDSIGELQAAYSLATVAIVGRSFNGMGGSNPIEPAALGCATLIGPDHRNFVDPVAALSAGGGLEVCEASEIVSVASALARDPGAASARAARGMEVVRRHQGATARTVELIERVLAGPVGS